MSGRVTLDNIRQSADTALNYMYDVTFDGAASDGGLINLRCISADLPQPTWTDVPVEIRGFTKHEAGAIEWNTLNFTVVETVNYEIINFLYNWGKLQFDPRSGFALDKVGGYESTATIALLNRQNAITSTWVCKGCVLQNITPDALGNDKGTPLNVSFTLAYDYAEVQ